MTQDEFGIVIDRKEHQRNVKKAYYLVIDPKKLTYAHCLCLQMMADRVLRVTLKNGSIDSIYELFPSGYVETKKRKLLTVSLVVGDLSTKVKIFQNSFSVSYA